MVKPHSSNFRVIITNFLGVRIFRKFTVHWLYRRSRNSVIKALGVDVSAPSHTSAFNMVDVNLQKRDSG